MVVVVVAAAVVVVDDDDGNSSNSLRLTLATTLLQDASQAFPDQRQ